MAGKGIAKARQLAAVVRDDAGAVEVEIAAHLKDTVRQLVTEVQVFQRAMQAKQQELRQLLHTGHGIDIAQPGWHVLADAGKLVRQAADLRPAQPPAAPVAQAPVVTPAPDAGSAPAQ